jgi:hypothetical protein
VQDDHQPLRLLLLGVDEFCFEHGKEITARRWSSSFSLSARSLHAEA